MCFIDRRSKNGCPLALSAAISLLPFMGPFVGLGIARSLLLLFVVPAAAFLIQLASAGQTNTLPMNAGRASAAGRMRLPRPSGSLRPTMRSSGTLRRRQPNWEGAFDVWQALGRTRGATIPSLPIPCR